MKVRSYSLTALLLFMLGTLIPVIMIRYRFDQRDSDGAQTAACCVATPLLVMSVLAVLVDLTRFLNERSRKNAPRISMED